MVLYMVLQDRGGLSRQWSLKTGYTHSISKLVLFSGKISQVNLLTAPYDPGLTLN